MYDSLALLLHNGSMESIDRIPSNRQMQLRALGLEDPSQQHDHETGSGEEVELNERSTMIGHHGLLKLKQTCHWLQFYDQRLMESDRNTYTISFCKKYFYSLFLCVILSIRMKLLSETQTN